MARRDAARGLSIASMSQPDARITEPAWPTEEPAPLILLVDASSALEYKLVQNWARRSATGPYELLRLPPSRRRRRHHRIDPRIETATTRSDNPKIVPIRVAWSAPERDGRRTVRLADLAKLGDPRDPDVFRQYAIVSMAPDRCRILVGEGAYAAELREAWTDSQETGALNTFIARRAWLALERAERHFRGNRYKVPKFTTEEMLRKAPFKESIAELAEEHDRSYESVHRQSARYLKEIAATHSPFMIDILANIIHWLYRQGYGSLNYDRAHLCEIYGLSEDHPVVFLPSHKSQLDRLVLQFILWENDLPPNHTAGGINLNFFPVGPIVRRTGVFFIRRSFKDNPVYKHALRSYIDYLLEQRFPLEWYPEGGRSRSGKLLPPRYGMLSYVIDSFQRGSADDVALIPVSIAYDQIQDVSEYAREQRGEAKEGESITWLVKTVRSLRKRYGNVHIRFGEPISVAKELSNGDDELAVQKLAFEVMVRINRVTPITATASVTLSLLRNFHRALSVDEIAEELTDLATYVLVNRLPITERIERDGKDQVQEVLDRLVENDVVTRFDSEQQTLYRVTEGQYLSAAYYRNTIVHYFVAGSIGELALAATVYAAPADREDYFWDEVMALRDLLKFEFFFAEKEEFRAEVDAELSTRSPNWRELLTPGDAPLQQSLRPVHSPWALRPFLEAYLVVADALATLDVPYDEKSFLNTALSLGKQYRLQDKISAEEAVSQVLFKSALGLAENRGLLREDATTAARQEFSDQVHAVVNRIDRHLT